MENRSAINWTAHNHEFTRIDYCLQRRSGGTQADQLIKIIEDWIQAHLTLGLGKHFFIVHQYASRSVMLILNLLLCAFKKTNPIGSCAGFAARPVPFSSLFPKR
jgi:hypothetical protein